MTSIPVTHIKKIDMSVEMVVVRALATLWQLEWMYAVEVEN